MSSGTDSRGAAARLRPWWVLVTVTLLAACGGDERPTAGPGPSAERPAAAPASAPRAATSAESAPPAPPPAAAQRPVDPAPDLGTVEGRIAAVERRLLPAVRIKGRPAAPMALADRMKAHGVQGVSIAVINDHRIEWARGYGVADAAAGSPVDGGTLFQAGSISKPVAAAAALVLVQNKKLDLDRGVRRWEKSWKVAENAFTKGHPVTLRGILSHTAGLTVSGFPGYPRGAALPTVAQILDGLPPANTPAVVVDQRPGEQFRYSGGGYTVLQLLLVDVTKKPFPDLVQELVLGPLPMTRSSYQQPPP